MFKFDKLINEVLGLGTLASATGSFLQAAQDPAKGLDIISKSIEKSKKEKEQTENLPYSLDNKPKENSLVVYADNREVVGRVVTPMDDRGQFGVQLIEPDEKTSQFSFVKTEKKPYWHIDYVSVIQNNHINGKDLILKEKNQKGKDVLQSSPTKEIPYILVGKNTRFENWISYEAYLKSNKK
jgi:hypothetical protein